MYLADFVPLHVASRFFEGNYISPKTGMEGDYYGLRRLVGRKLNPGVVAKEESDIYFRCDSGKATVVRCPPEEVLDEEV